MDLVLRFCRVRLFAVQTLELSFHLKFPGVTLATQTSEACTSIWSSISYQELISAFHYNHS